MSEIDWPPILGYSIFCEDIREETEGKRSYMGVFQAVMDIPADLPVFLHKFCVAVHYSEVVEAEDKPLTLMVFLPQDSEDAPSMSVQLPDGNRLQLREEARKTGQNRIALIVPVQLTPFPVIAFGDLRVRMRRGEDEIVRLGRLTIRRGPNLPPQDVISGSILIPSDPTQPTLPIPS